MIVSLEGRLALKEPNKLVIEVAGIGYEVLISLNTFSKVGKHENIKLHTHLIVKEDSHTLYGFFEGSEKHLFQQLIKISGVGGNTALTILSSVSPKELEHAIATENVAMLKKIKGIGAKTAGRIILELSGKLKTEGSIFPAAEGSAGKKRQEAMAALQTLGFSRAEIDKRLDAIIQDKGDEVGVEEMIKLALKK